MKFSLKQTEIQAAIGLYLGAQGIDTEGKTITYAFKSGRGGNGVTVAVDIESDAVTGTAMPARKLGQSVKGQLSGTGSAAIAEANSSADTKPATTVAVVEEVKDVVVAEAKTEAAPVAEVTQEVITAAEAAGDTATDVAVEVPADAVVKGDTAVDTEEKKEEVPPVQEAAPESKTNIFGD